MSFEIKRGLAEFGYPDHYAVLGLAVDASPSDIRKRYLHLARALHPDSCASVDKEQASQVLSRLVNPAYQFLSQDKERTDYGMLLKLIGQRANLELDTAQLRFQGAKDLLTHDQYETFYHATVQELAEAQYSKFGRVVSVIEQLSELNLTFLLRRELVQTSRGNAFAFAEPVPPIATQPSSPEVSVTTPTKEPIDQQKVASPTDDYVSKYIRRAEDLSAKNLFQDAIKELKDALRLDPQNFRCTLLLGLTYLKLKQPKMAKEYLLKAQKVDPKNAEVLQGMKDLKAQESTVTKPAPAAAKGSSTAAKQPERQGLMGWFGKKK